MPFYFFMWDDETVDHLDQHGVTCDEFMEIVQRPLQVEISESSGRWIAFGHAADGRYLACVYELIGQDTILPVTAFELDDES